MIDFGKLYCDLHPNEIITNFCLKETCMIGLCATCICTHTQHHMQNKTTPEYQNIRSTFSSMHDLIRKRISLLDNQKKRIEKITQFIQTKKRTVKQNIQQTRRQAIAVVNNFFDNKEKILLREMQSEQKKMGLHSEARMESLMNSLNRQTSLLISSAQELNSQNFLESYQRIKTQNLSNAAKLELEVARQLDQNQDFQTIINTNEEFIEGILRALDQSLQISFKLGQRPVQKIQQGSNAYYGTATVLSDKRSSQPWVNTPESLTQPVYLSRPSSSTQSNMFSSISFSNVPQISKKETAKFNSDEPDKETTKSIPLQQNQKNQYQNFVQTSQSFNKKQMSRSDIMKVNPSMSQILKQRNNNERGNSQGSKSSLPVNRNHQSQIIIVEKPFLNQSGAGWNNGKDNCSQPMNESLIQNFQRTYQEKTNRNASSQIFYGNKNQSTMNLMHHKQYQPNLQNIQKPNFFAQVYDPNQQFPRSNQNQSLMSECKKVRKSGLTLLKGVHTNSTSRSKLHQ